MNPIKFQHVSFQSEKGLGGDVARIGNAMARITTGISKAEADYSKGRTEELTAEIDYNTGRMVEAYTTGAAFDVGNGHYNHEKYQAAVTKHDAYKLDKESKQLSVANQYVANASNALKLDAQKATQKLGIDAANAKNTAIVADTPVQSSILKNNKKISDIDASNAKLYGAANAKIAHKLNSVELANAKVDEGIKAKYAAKNARTNSALKDQALILSKSRTRANAVVEANLASDAAIEQFKTEALDQVSYSAPKSLLESYNTQYDADVKASRARYEKQKEDLIKFNNSGADSAEGVKRADELKKTLALHKKFEANRNKSVALSVHNEVNKRVAEKDVSKLTATPLSSLQQTNFILKKALAYSKKHPNASKSINKFVAETRATSLAKQKADNATTKLNQTTQAKTTAEYNKAKDANKVKHNLINATMNKLFPFSDTENRKAIKNLLLKTYPSKKKFSAAEIVRTLKLSGNKLLPSKYRNLTEAQIMKLVNSGKVG